MNKFVCPRCHLNTRIRTHFKRHLTRKNICKPVYKDIPIKSIAESYGIYIPSTDNNSEMNSNTFSNTCKQQIQTNSSAQTHTNL